MICPNCLQFRLIRPAIRIVNSGNNGVFRTVTNIGVRKYHQTKTLCNLDETGTKSNKVQDSNEGPLVGIRVLDLTRVLAGPYCTMILGDLGAEILKVERPGVGDDTRHWGPPFLDELSSYFVAINRNKKSIAIDMKTPEGQGLMKQLVTQSDVLVENFIPGTMEKSGLGYKDLSSLNPRLIYCTITGYGQDGPYARRGGYDVIAASLGGLLHITGPKDGEPCKVGVAMTDLATGLYAHGAIMAALLQRHTTNRGQRIDSNLLSTQISCLVNLGSNYLNAGRAVGRLGTAHDGIVPYQAFQTKDDKWITVGAGNNGMFHELCQVLELPQLLKDPKYSTNATRVENREELISIIQRKFRSKTSKEWLMKFENQTFPYGPVNNLKEAFEDPQVRHNKMVRELGKYKVVGPAVTYSSSKNEPRRPPPLLGQHTREILRDVCKLSSDEIEILFSKSIVQ